MYSNRIPIILLSVSLLALMVDSYLKEMQLSQLKRRVERQRAELDEINFLIYKLNNKPNGRASRKKAGTKKG